MARRSRGFRSRTRRKLKRKSTARTPVSRTLAHLEKGQKVLLSPDPSVHGGLPHPRYKGKMGSIKAKRGLSYVVEIKDGGKTKEVVSRPEHLRKVEV